MAIQRALESSRPAGRRLFVDPFARTFVSPAWRLVLAGAHRRPVRGAVEVMYDAVGGPGPRASAIARTRLIDDHITSASPDQLVILGAGYDTRAHRLDCLARAAVYEVDRAETQARKISTVAGEALPTSRPPTYVSVDFEHDDVVRALTSAGFTSHGRTVFLWEGVTQYLSADAIDETLSAIRRLGQPRDVLLFTYVDEAALRSPNQFPEAEKWMRGTERRGEPWIFGITPSRLDEYLGARGLSVASDCSTRDAGERYFPPLGRSERGSDLYHVVSATID